MPHLILEYTKNLTLPTVNEILLNLNKTLVDSGQFQEMDIKSRAICLDTFCIGVSSEERAFVHVKLSILEGRSIDIKRDLSARLLQVLQEAYARFKKTQIQLCVEILEIERASYVKNDS